jgi:hypothetical protein
MQQRARRSRRPCLARPGVCRLAAELCWRRIGQRFPGERQLSSPPRPLVSPRRASPMWSHRSASCSNRARCSFHQRTPPTPCGRWQPGHACCAKRSEPGGERPLRMIDRVCPPTSALPPPPQARGRRARVGRAETETRRQRRAYVLEGGAFFAQRMHQPLRRALPRPSLLPEQIFCFFFPGFRPLPHVHVEASVLSLELVLCFG